MTEELYGVIFLIGCLFPEPYSEYYFGLIVVIRVISFLFLSFGLMEISKGRLQWGSTQSAAPVPTEKKAEYSITRNDIYIKIEQMVSLKEKGILSEEEFNEQKKKMLGI